MILEGFVKGEKCYPYIKISVRSNSPKIAKSFDFLIDTGSDITFIGYKDFLTTGISFNSLGKGARNIFGLSSPTQNWPIKAVLYFIDQDKKVQKFPFIIYIAKTSPKCTSILGRDFLIKNEFKLVYIPSEKKVYLEK